MSDHATGCPLCGQAMRDPHPIDVCAACHSTVVEGDVKVGATGEFGVEQILAAAEAHAAAAVTGPQPAAGDAVRCSWCGKTDAEVRKILTRGAHHICNECVALCAAVMQAELGKDWR